MEIFKQLNKKGYKHYYEGTIEELDLMDKNNSHLHSEIMQVIMWLYEKHRIWIEVHHRGDYGDFAFKVSKLKKNLFRVTPHYIDETGYNSPTEAYEAAIKYVLENLI